MRPSVTESNGRAGKSLKVVHKEIYDGLDELATRALGGTTVFQRHGLLMMDRDETLAMSDVLEEVYYTWSFIPWRARFPDGSLRVFGFVNHAIETTSEVIAQRRLQVLSALQKRTAEVDARVIRSSRNRLVSYRTATCDPCEPRRATLIG